METPQKNGDACRLCNDNKEKMHNIFDKNDHGKQIIRLIKECLPIIIFRTDPLSKRICVDCFTKLESFYLLKKTSMETAAKHLTNLRGLEGRPHKSIQLYLACENSHATTPQNNNIPAKTTVATSTDDLTISCINCKSTYFDSSIINSEVELCAELHKAIADSLTINKVPHSDEKVARSRRRKSQAFYHELDDSLCSSMTEFTNTESSQCYEEYHSEMDSYESEADDPSRVKRRRLLETPEAPAAAAPAVLEDDKQRAVLQDLFKAQLEHRYFPLTLMQLALNAINKANVPEYEPHEFYGKVVEPKCTYCDVKFVNSELLALHEVQHINIELGEKMDHPVACQLSHQLQVDNPVAWHESRDDATIRNKWLHSYDEVPEDECDSEVDTNAGESLLIPVGSEIPVEHKGVEEEIELIDAKAIVNGIALAEYTKDERKSFYKTMKIGGVNKKFCSLCRYSFKDNWAIESHYFSSACYFTCRYCGMRFNKQRHKFDEHTAEHEARGESLSVKIYAASKLSNVVPRIIHADKDKIKVKKVAPEELEDAAPQKAAPPAARARNAPPPRKSLPAKVHIKEEKLDPELDSAPPAKKSAQGKSSNQAYFCRKCYKVFFKLDEFNIHSKNCDYNQFPGAGRNSKSPAKGASNGEMLSMAGRPLRNCVRESNHREKSPSPVEKVEEKKSFVCFICSTAFPTIYSRNSHMRIHKGEINKQPVKQVSTRHQAKQAAAAATPTISAPNFIKQEQLEPEVEIHETEQLFGASVSVGAVSITPISKNPNQKATINPNIMRLVQNNPHLTIRANKSPERQSAPSGSATHYSPDGDKSYKCSSCWEAFVNKSDLYFHKKNSCDGSKYPCPFCKKRFGTEAAYSSHIFYSHPE